MNVSKILFTKPTIQTIVQLNQILQELTDKFLNAAKKAKNIGDEVLAHTRSVNDFEIALSESTLAKRNVDQLHQELGEKTFAYFMQGGDMKALAKALYEDPSEQAAFLGKISAELSKRLKP